MKIKIDRCDTLWFLIPSVCLDFHPKANRLEIALMFLNWQIALDFPFKKKNDKSLSSIDIQEAEETLILLNDEKDYY